MRWILAGMAVVAVATPGVTAGATEAHAKARTVRVEPGQSLWGIARTHHCSVEALRRTNELGDGPLLAGRRLTLPAPCQDAAAPGGKGGTAGRMVVHEVVAGDTLSRIARRNGTTVEALTALNELESTEIRVGQSLRIRPAPPVIHVVAGQSVGRPQRGKLVSGVQLPHDRAYYRRRPQKAYGAQHTVDHVRAVIAAVRRAHPGLHRLAIGDLSKPKGGPIREHHSHQSGRDIDLGLYYEKVPPAYPKEFVSVDDAELDVAATWALVEELIAASKRPGGPEKIFLDYGIQRRLYEHALAHGESKSSLKKIFQYPAGKGKSHRLIQHVPRHDDHLHVRFACPPKDRKCR